MKRASGIYIFALIMLALAWCAWLKAATLTPIYDTVVNADGSRFQGNIVIAWSPFTTSDGTNVPGGQKVVTVVSGLLRMNLTPYGGYTASFQPSAGPATIEYWNVPASSLPLRLADLHSPPVFLTPGVFSQVITTAMTGAYIPAATHGCGANPVWRVWDTSAGWTGVDGVLDAGGNLTLSWAGSFAGVVRIGCGALAPNYSAAFTTGTGTLLIPAANSGITTASLAVQCYDSGGHSIGVDYSVDGNFNVSAAVNPSNATAIAGRCVLGAI